MKEKHISSKLIVDSGSTKTHWCLISEHQLPSHYYTQGINPYFQTETDITQIVERELLPQSNSIKDVEHIYFYGSGLRRRGGDLL